MLYMPLFIAHRCCFSVIRMGGMASKVPNPKEKRPKGPLNGPPLVEFGRDKPSKTEFAL
jgi:hypothetical protein